MLQIAGEVDLTTVAHARSALFSLIAQRPSDIVVDLGGLMFCSSRGLTVLMEGAAAAAQRSVGFAVCATSGTMLRQWALLWPDRELPVRHATVGQGVITAMHRQIARTGPTVVLDPRASAEDEAEPARLSHGGEGEADRALARRQRARMYRSALRSLAGSPDPADPDGDLAVHLRSSLEALARTARA